MADHTTTLFERAVDAVISGDIPTLKTLLKSHPDLATACSQRPHQATLLHYVAANGVETERQKTPANVVDVARTLLDAGADPNATAKMYGVDLSVLHALISSAHPAEAGKMADLVTLLCTNGANPNGQHPDDAPLHTAISSRALDAINALVAVGALVDTLLFAAAVGDLTQVRALMTDSDEERSRAMIAASMAGHLHIVKVLHEAGAEVNALLSPVQGTALHEACVMGHIEIVRYLLAHQPDLTVQDNQGFTPLHWAAWHQHMAIIDLLLAHGAPLEIQNDYGGTVLDTVVYAFTQTYYLPDNPLPTVQKLVNAGADVSAVSPFPTGRADIDKYLSAYRPG